jgi:hypothetical protein
MVILKLCCQFKKNVYVVAVQKSDFTDNFFLGIIPLWRAEPLGAYCYSVKFSPLLQM